MGLRWEGIDETIAALDAISDRVLAQAPVGLLAGIQRIEEASVPLVPVESGTLVGSREVKVEGMTASIEYGTPYARYQHYRLDLHHETGQPLFQEQAVRTEKDAAIGDVAHAIGDAL